MSTHRYKVLKIRLPSSSHELRWLEGPSAPTYEPIFEFVSSATVKSSQLGEWSRRFAEKLIHCPTSGYLQAARVGVLRRCKTSPTPKALLYTSHRFSSCGIKGVVYHSRIITCHVTFGDASSAMTSVEGRTC